MANIIGLILINAADSYAFVGHVYQVLGLHWRNQISTNDVDIGFDDIQGVRAGLQIMMIVSLVLMMDLTFDLVVNNDSDIGLVMDSAILPIDGGYVGNHLVQPSDYPLHHGLH